MPKKTTSKQCILHEVKLSELHTKLDTLTAMFSGHIQESKEVRDTIVRQSERFDWHKKWLYGLTAGVLSLASWITGRSFYGD